ncbi:glycosyltransferase [Calditrichota bacterium GD2]
MDWLLVIALFLAFFYLGLTIALSLFPAPSALTESSKLRVAVLIAMRNEENFIGDCLTALAKQTYPADLYDVFVLNDGSTDRSPMIAEQFARQNSNFHVLHIKENYAGLRGKMNVLAQGLQKIDHPLVLITDADCVVSQTWIERMTRYFSPEVGMVGGFTSLFPFGKLNITQPELSFFARIQALDWAYLQAMAALNSNAGKPISILGNNFAFRLEAYRQVGGFERIGFSVTEDFALMEAIRKQTQWKIIHTIDPLNAVYSHPLPNFKSFFQQRLRWIAGGKKMRPWGYFVTLFSAVTHLTTLIALFFNFTYWAVWLAPTFLMAADFFVLFAALKKLTLRQLLKYFAGFEMFYFFYLIAFSLLSAAPLKVEWKGRRHS